MLRFITILFCLLIGFGVGGLTTFANARTQTQVRLVLQITVDGLRGDLLNRYDYGFGKDG